jgi:predicted ATP-dependent endonuclease of OLD family
MYISKLEIEGFRNLDGTTVNFTEGINVIIGPNNSGKSNIFKALSLLLDHGGEKRLGINDFSKNTNLESLQQAPPSIKVSIYFTEIPGESTDEDLVTVSDWLLKVDTPFEARLTYKYYLPENELVAYQDALDNAENTEEGWRIIERDFLRKYSYRILGGNPTHQKRAEGDALRRVDWQFLDAVRDVDRDLFSSRRNLLKEVINFFKDYEIKTDESKEQEEIDEALRNKSKEFEQEAKPLIDKLLKRTKSGKKEILKYVTDTGALFDESKPKFSGTITDSDIVELLELIIQHQTGLKISAENNGLGYNNLIYMSFLLAKMQINADSDYYGSNVKLFPVLAVEEPEAHLHPSMQNKFLQFLKKNLKERVKQVFISTHSTHVTSSVSLDDLICLTNEITTPSISYPSQVFDDSSDDKSSKSYVERFLDATKSNMLFAHKLIFVEGIAEKLLMPTLAKYVDGLRLEDEHIEVISVDSRYFDHFLKLFETSNENALEKKVACIVDRDPSRKKDGNSRFEKCYPYEYEINGDDYDYENYAESCLGTYDETDHIKYFSSLEKYGKTFEYDLAFSNPTFDSLLTESMSNQDEIKKMMEDFEDVQEINGFNVRESDENNRILESLQSSDLEWDIESKKKALIASRYLNSVSKGENALELATKLEQDLSSDSPQFNIPKHFKDAIEWLKDDQ